MNIENNINKFKYFFYNTENFEVFCFCPISIINKMNVVDIKQNNNTKIDTNYFFVGGYQTKLRKGVIKLYKINHEDNFLDTEIEFIQDIEIEKNTIFKGFRGPISCITQSSVDGKILATCWDGNVYLFDHTNIQLYLDYEEKTKNDLCI